MDGLVPYSLLDDLGVPLFSETPMKKKRKWMEMVLPKWWYFTRLLGIKKGAEPWRMDRS